MENFSTPPRAVVPWVANLATLVVLVTAAWWSNANRPAAVAGESALAAPAAAPGALTPATAAPADASGTAPPAGERAWPRQTTATAREGLQTVSFGPSRH